MDVHDKLAALGVTCELFRYSIVKNQCVEFSVHILLSIEAIEFKCPLNGPIGPTSYIIISYHSDAYIQRFCLILSLLRLISKSHFF